MVTCDGQAVGLVESLYLDLVDSNEYLLGVSGGGYEFSLGHLEGV